MDFLLLGLRLGQISIVQLGDFGLGCMRLE